LSYTAVVFDLFGTLVPSFLEPQYRESIMSMATILGHPHEAFWELWKEGFNGRILGLITDCQTQVRLICRGLGSEPSEQEIELAVKVRHDYEMATMTPRPDAVKTLTTLKKAGLKLGLISDCSNEAVVAWPLSPLSGYMDFTIFSCEVGMKKPDPRIFRLALDKLGVPPSSVLYVGDGGSSELSGATEAGMQTVQIRAPGEDSPDAYVVGRQEWNGRWVVSLSEAAEIVLNGHPGRDGDRKREKRDPN